MGQAHCIAMCVLFLTFSAVHDSVSGLPGPADVSGLIGDVVTVKGGEFRMGAKANAGRVFDRPCHTVTVSSFIIASREVSIGQFADFLNRQTCSEPSSSGSIDVDGVTYATLSDSGLEFENRRYHPTCDALLPAIVTWQGADAYCRFVGGRLPTEAEWEYTARAGAETLFPWGDDFDESLANGRSTKNEMELVLKTVDDQGHDFYVYKGGPNERAPDNALKPVGSYAPNGWGIFDMIGNAEEWCADWFGADYYSDLASRFPNGVTNPTGPREPSTRMAGEELPSYRYLVTFPTRARVLRGGSYKSDTTRLGCAFRGFAGQHECVAGFRCVFPSKKTHSAD